jgi:hypothetical protein
LAKKENAAAEAVQFSDYVQIYEPTLSHNDIIAIASAFIKMHPKEIIVFASLPKASTDFPRKPLAH